MYHLLKGLYLYASSKEGTLPPLLPSLPSPPPSPTSQTPSLTQTNPTEYSIILLGLDNAGKTTLLSQIKTLHLSPTPPTHPAPPPPPTVPTVGQNVSTIALPDLYLKLWDVGGQHSLRRLWRSYYGSCHAIVFVVDSSDVGNGDERSEEHGSHNSHGEQGKRNEQGKWGSGEGRLEECRLVLESVLRDEAAEGVPLLVLANKQDREDCVEVVRIKEGLVRPVFEGQKGGGVRDSRVLPVSALTGAGVREAVEWLCSRVKLNRESRPPVMR